MKNNRNGRYMDDLGNFSINQMSLLEVINECTTRMNLLDKNNLQVKKESDLRILRVLGQPYTVFQYIHFPETEDSREYARAILIHFETQDIVPLRFEAYYNEETNEHYSHAHRFLDNLRELCIENNLFTDSEHIFLVDKQYR